MQQKSLNQKNKLRRQILLHLLIIRDKPQLCKRSVRKLFEQRLIKLSMVMTAASNAAYERGK